VILPEAGPDLLAGAQRRDVAAAGVRLSVLRAGPARRRRTTPVLLLHGVPQTAVAFRHLIPELAHDREVLAPDLKGLGSSECAGPYDVATLVRELAALVLCEVDGPVDVVGHDWGGSLALALAGARPDLVRRLVVVNAPYRQLDLLRGAHIVLAALPLVPEALLTVSGRRGREWLARVAWKSDVGPEPAVLEHYAAAYAAPERRSAMLAYYRSNVRPRLRRSLRAAFAKPRVEHPGKAETSRTPGVSVDRALVLWGAADPVMPVRVGEAVVRDLGPGVDMVTLPGVGHFPLEEAPEMAVPVIASFLRDGERVAAPARSVDG
jgi:pimeloyl-ACP methyl ester carboxylesterase